MADVFRATLEQLTKKVEGVRGVSLIGRDGIAVDSVVRDDGNALDQVAAEMTGFLSNLAAADLGLDAGLVEQLSVVTTNALVILSTVTREYFLLMLLSRDGNFGRARFELRKAAGTLMKELI